MSVFKKKHELYKVTDSKSTYNLTNSNKFITYNNDVYEPAPIDRSGINLKSEMEKMSVSITLDISHPLATRHLSTVIEDKVNISIFENFDGEYLSLWKGRLVSVSANENDVELKFETSSTRQLKTGVSRKYQRSCPYALYGEGCKVNISDYTFRSIITENNGVQINVVVDGVFNSDYFVGGMISIDSGFLRYITNAVVLSAVEIEKTVIETYENIDDVSMRRLYRSEISYNGISSYYTEEEVLDYDEGMIGTSETTSVSSGTEIILTMFSQFNVNIVGVGSQISAGCDKSIKTCNVKFENSSNFGGFPYIPFENPYTKSIVS